MTKETVIATARRSPIEATLVFHPALPPELAGDRKAMAAAAQGLVADGVARAIAGRE